MIVFNLMTSNLGSASGYHSSGSSYFGRSYSNDYINILRKILRDILRTEIVIEFVIEQENRQGLATDKNLRDLLNRHTAASLSLKVLLEINTGKSLKYSSPLSSSLKNTLALSSVLINSPDILKFPVKWALKRYDQSNLHLNRALLLCPKADLNQLMLIAGHIEYCKNQLNGIWNHT